MATVIAAVERLKTLQIIARKRKMKKMFVGQILVGWIGAKPSDARILRELGFSGEMNYNPEKKRFENCIANVAALFSVKKELPHYPCHFEQQDVFVEQRLYEDDRSDGKQETLVNSSVNEGWNPFVVGITILGAGVVLQAIGLAMRIYGGMK